MSESKRKNNLPSEVGGTRGNSRVAKARGNVCVDEAVMSARLLCKPEKSEEDESAKYNQPATEFD